MAQAELQQVRAERRRKDEYHVEREYNVVLGDEHNDAQSIT